MWEILGIPPTRDIKVIRRRYAELVRQYHPEDEPEIYQQIVQAYQAALDYARASQHRQDGHSYETSSGFNDWKAVEELPSLRNRSLDFETIQASQVQENMSQSNLDFSHYDETPYLIRASMESIMAHSAHSLEEQEKLWQQLFYQYGHQGEILKSCLEDLDVYVFTETEQFDFIKSLIEGYLVNYQFWGYYHKLKYWKIKMTAAKQSGKPIEEAKKVTAQLYASYCLCQEILSNAEKANQIRTWIDFFKQPFSSETLLSLVKERRFLFKNFSVLNYILNRIGQQSETSDPTSFEVLTAYLESLKKVHKEMIDFEDLAVEENHEIEEVFYLLLFTYFPDDYSYLRSWQQFFDRVRDQAYLLKLLEEVDVYPLTNPKLATLVLQYVEQHQAYQESVYLKKLHFWKMVRTNLSRLKQYNLEQREVFDYWFREGYLYAEEILTNADLIDDRKIWESYLKTNPHIFTVLLDQLYHHYRHFQDGEVLKFILGHFVTSRIAPTFTTAENDKKLDEMSAYAYTLQHPLSKKDYDSWKKGQILKNIISQVIIAVVTFFCFMQSVQTYTESDRWINAGVLCLYYFFLLGRQQFLIEEGIKFRGDKLKVYFNSFFWFLLVFVLTLNLGHPFGLLAMLAFLAFFSFIDGFKVNQGYVWPYQIDVLLYPVIFLTSGFFVSLVMLDQIVAYVFIFYIYLLIIIAIALTFTRLRPGFPSSTRSLILPALLGIALVPFYLNRLAFFDPLFLSGDTLGITVLMLLNTVALSYFSKEQRSSLSVKKPFLIFSLQFLIFLRRFVAITFINITDITGSQLPAHFLISELSELTFYCLEGLFVLLMFILVRKIRDSVNNFV